MSIKSANAIWNEIKEQSGQMNASLSSTPHLLETNVLLTQSLNSVFSGQEPDVETLKRASEQLPNSIPSLSGDTQTYFAKLYRICDLIIQDSAN